MAPGCSSDLDTDARRALSQLARRAIAHRLQHGARLAVDPHAFVPALRAVAASFVTLRKGEILRGCIGNLTAEFPLAVDVARNAYSAAFEDPRFPPLRADELEALTIHLSVLSTPEPLAVESQADLLAQLRPGVDGVILSDGALRATFLPSVWEGLPEPADFIAQLKRKAKMDAKYWSDTIKVERYTTVEWGEE